MTTRTEGKMTSSGTRFFAIGVPLLVAGIVLALLLEGTARGIGLAVAVLGAIPIVVGIVLLASAGLEQRSRKDKPYA